MADWDQSGKTPVLSAVSHGDRLEDLYELLQIDGKTTRSFRSVRSPSRLSAGYYDSDLTHKDAGGWVLPAFSCEPVPGKLLICGLSVTGDNIPLLPAALNDWYGTRVGWGNMEWTRDGGLRRLPTPALHHWITTLPNMERFRYLLD